MRGSGSVRDPSFVGRTRGEEQRKKSKGKREKWEGGSRRGNPNVDSNVTFCLDTKSNQKSQDLDIFAKKQAFS